MCIETSSETVCETVLPPTSSSTIVIVRQRTVLMVVVRRILSGVDTLRHGAATCGGVTVVSLSTFCNRNNECSDSTILNAQCYMHVYNCVTCMCIIVLHACVSLCSQHLRVN